MKLQEDYDYTATALEGSQSLLHLDFESNRVIYMTFTNITPGKLAVEIPAEVKLDPIAVREMVYRDVWAGICLGFTVGFMLASILAAFLFRLNKK